jgi:Domain of unknown function (DUF1413)
MNLPLNVSLPLVLAQQLIAEAVANDRSLDEQIVFSLMQIHAENNSAGARTVATAAQDWLAAALARAKAKNPGDEFLLQDLFSDAEWGLIPQHSVFGRYFNKALKEMQPQYATRVRKTDMNQSIYARL